MASHQNWQNTVPSSQLTHKNTQFINILEINQLLSQTAENIGSKDFYRNIQQLYDIITTNSLQNLMIGPMYKQKITKRIESDLDLVKTDVKKIETGEIVPEGMFIIPCKNGSTLYEAWDYTIKCFKELLISIKQWFELINHKNQLELSVFIDKVENLESPLRRSVFNHY